MLNLFSAVMLIVLWNDGSYSESMATVSIKMSPTACDEQKAEVEKKFLEKDLWDDVTVTCLKD